MALSVLLEKIITASNMIKFGQMSSTSELGLGRTQVEIGQILKPSDIQTFYISVDKERSRGDVLRMIGLYPSWQGKILDASSIGNLDWYLDKDPNHVSHFLTQNGTKRRVSDVAEVYMANRQKLRETWSGAAKIEDMIKSLELGKEMPPIIVIEGERYLNSPESSFVDGVHRALAAAVCNISSPYNNVHQSAFIGKKANFIIRVMKRIGF